MAKRIGLAAVAVFVVWAIMDFVIHGLLLRGAYIATASLWRPQAEMKLGVMYLAVFLAALAFSAVYGWFVTPKGPATGWKFGLLYGAGVGVGMGYGTYAVMAIPYTMAFTWFAGSAVEGLVAGLVVGAIIRD